MPADAPRATADDRYPSGDGSDERSAGGDPLPHRDEERPPVADRWTDPAAEASTAADRAGRSSRRSGSSGDDVAGTRDVTPEDVGDPAEFGEPLAMSAAQGGGDPAMDSDLERDLQRDLGRDLDEPGGFRSAGASALPRARPRQPNGGTGTPVPPTGPVPDPGSVPPDEASAPSPSMGAPDAIPPAPALGAEPAPEGSPAAHLRGPAGEPAAPGGLAAVRSHLTWLRRSRPDGKRARVRGLRVNQRLWSVDPWSVFKISVLFYLCLFFILMVAGTLLWNVGRSSGTIDQFESFVTRLGAYGSCVAEADVPEGTPFENDDDCPDGEVLVDGFQLDDGTIFRASAIGGVVLVITGSFGNVLMTVLLNLINEVSGGTRYTIIKEPTPRSSGQGQGRSRGQPGRRDGSTRVRVGR
jgi:hypothetical protein